MWVALVPSGMDWLDAEIGGVPASGVVAAAGKAGAGKTSLALAFAVAQLKRGGRVCWLTSETPEAVLETCRGVLELDLRAYIAQGALTLLAYAPFFINKVRSLSSVDLPLAELNELFQERHIQHVVIDTLDPMLAWIDGANAKASVRTMLGHIQAWNRSVFCTMGGTAPAVAELARTVSGSFEIGDGKIVVRQAGWCNVYDIEAPLQFVQGRGLVVRPPPKSAYPGGPAKVLDSVKPSSVPISSVDEHKPWTSLIGDANKLLGPNNVLAAARELFSQTEAAADATDKERARFGDADHGTPIDQERTVLRPAPPSEPTISAGPPTTRMPSAPDIRAIPSPPRHLDDGENTDVGLVLEPPILKGSGQPPRRPQAIRDDPALVQEDATHVFPPRVPRP